MEGADRHNCRTCARPLVSIFTCSASGRSRHTVRFQRIRTCTLNVFPYHSCLLVVPLSVVVSGSDGSVSVVMVSGATGSGAVERSWPAHGYEAWITTFSASSDHLVYSGPRPCVDQVDARPWLTQCRHRFILGGDDTLFRGWDLRTDCTVPAFTSKK